MLVIHPKDSSTEFLCTIYEGAEGVTCLRGNETRKNLGDILYHRPAGETFLLLGHGSPDGLFRKEADGYRCYVGRSMAFSLKKHPVIGIWCHADLFAEAMGLHGLFTGMIISEMEEAALYGVKTTEEEIELENRRLAMNIRRVLDEGGTSRVMREKLMILGNPNSELTHFNYNSIYVK